MECAYIIRKCVCANTCFGVELISLVVPDAATAFASVSFLLAFPFSPLLLLDNADDGDFLRRRGGLLSLVPAAAGRPVWPRRC